MKTSLRLIGASILVFVGLHAPIARAGGTDACIADLIKHGYIQQDNEFLAHRSADLVCTQNTPDQIAHARQLIDGHYVISLKDALHEVKTSPPEQIECAKKEFDAKPPSDRKFFVSQACRDLALAPKAGAAKGGNTLVDVIAAAGNCGMFLKAAAAAGLTQSLAGGGPFTLFVPTDAAFGKFPEGWYDALLKNPSQLKQVMGNHIVSGLYPTSVVFKADDNRLKTLAGTHIRVEQSKKGIITAGKGTVIKPDVPASNGIIYYIDDLAGPGPAAPGATPRPARTSCRARRGRRP
jgi:uncharacterized surface protein with fasciclin (FAS1) repeats